MNMIPLVRATEPGRAQTVNPKPWLVNCSLATYYHCNLLRKSHWKMASERVRIPCSWLGCIVGVRFLSRVLWIWCAKWEVIFF